MSGPYESGFSLREKVSLGAEIVAAYGRARWLLWRTDLPSTVTALRSRAAPTRGDDADERARLGYRLGNAIGRTLRHLPFDSRCLMRSLVLTSILARRGVDSMLVVAVRSEPQFAAHAWVEHEGEPLLAPAEAPFQRIIEL